MHRAGGTLSAAMCVIAIFLFSGCAPADPARPTTATVATPLARPTPMPGVSTPAPTSSTAYAHERAHPDPYFDTGYWVQITAAGFRPAQLVAPCCNAISWKNLSGTPITVVFDHVLGGSQTAIPPGGTYVFTPLNVESITYHSEQNPALKGIISVNQLPE
jgi:hypothetical protein